MPSAQDTTKQREQKAPVPEEEESSAKIVHLYVREDWRGRRVATNLLRRLVEHIGQQKSPSIVATCAAVDSRNEHAVKAYTNAGFILSTQCTPCPTVVVLMQFEESYVVP
ncbi:hypothetical protein FOZ62_025890 [Perkinsus olseni]|nr:hypothetical protein FOZ62_025890 [Perkinsus olseni]